MKTSLLPLLCLACMPGLSYAEITFSPYVGMGYENQRIDIDDTEFDTSLLVLHAGVWVLDGVGFELELGKGLGDDTVSGVSTEHTQLIRYGVRLMTPISENQTVLYVLFSGATATLDTQTNGNNIPGENSFDGFHAGIGIGTQLNSQFQLDISYNNYQVDESFDISGVRLSVQYSLLGAAR